jgi:hypothetical protein
VDAWRRTRGRTPVAIHTAPPAKTVSAFPPSSMRSFAQHSALGMVRLRTVQRLRDMANSVQPWALTEGPIDDI